MQRNCEMQNYPNFFSIKLNNDGGKNKSKISQLNYSLQFQNVFIPIKNQFNSFFGPKKPYENFIHSINAICLKKNKKNFKTLICTRLVKFVIFMIFQEGIWI